MSELTQFSPSLRPPSSTYFGQYKGTMSIYHCPPDTTREDLLTRVCAWLEEELGPKLGLPRTFRLGGMPSRTLPIPPERVGVVTCKMLESTYASSEKATALNLAACSVVFADRLVGGEQEPLPLLAVVDGSRRELVLLMPRYAKAEPPKPDAHELRLHSPDLTHVDWAQCLRSLQEAKLVETERSAVWGGQQRRAEWAVVPPPSREHEWRMLFLGLHEDLLGMVEEFRMTLPLREEVF